MYVVDNINSDDEDDKPQYVRLMLKAYTVHRFRPKSPSSNSNDSTDAGSTPGQQNSLAGMYTYRSYLLL